ncbi:MBL fold metallo-hydrolase [Nakamurella antarctica]|uniref:MBL fold metallo-hydrolase n=2 Tax=Nakamurella antarctica TaxID=1902245 RepID=A0A3G8ZQ03_9ACTN|nr:MBL fold metallo-hydrolase [Nakamurella antarctica]
MTLDGTNTYVIRHPGARSVVVVDPGPLDADHLAELAGGYPVELVLITHHHLDHTEAAPVFHAMTGAPVRALDPEQCHVGEALVDGEMITAAGVTISVLATPGHTGDSVCFVLPDDGPTGAVVTGDTILGRGTSVIDYPHGRLGWYLESLARLAALGPALVLPAHGPTLPDLAQVAQQYGQHRAQRLDQVRAAVARLQGQGQSVTSSAVTDLVYTDINEAVRGAATLSVMAQLEYLLGSDFAAGKL